MSELVIHALTSPQPSPTGEGEQPPAGREILILYVLEDAVEWGFGVYDGEKFCRLVNGIGMMWTNDVRYWMPIPKAMQDLQTQTLKEIRK